MQLQQEIDWVKQGVEMKKIVKKFQCVRLVFDPASRFLRDTCFNLWKKLYVTNNSYRNIQVRKALKYRISVWKEWVRNKYKIHRRNMQFDPVNKKIIIDERFHQHQQHAEDSSDTHPMITEKSSPDGTATTDLDFASVTNRATSTSTVTEKETVLSSDSEDDREVMDIAQSLNEKLERISELQNAIEKRSSFMIDSVSSCSLWLFLLSTCY